MSSSVQCRPFLGKITGGRPVQVGGPGCPGCGFCHAQVAAQQKHIPITHRSTEMAGNYFVKQTKDYIKLSSTIWGTQ